MNMELSLHAELARQLAEVAARATEIRALDVKIQELFPPFFIRSSSGYRTIDELLDAFDKASGAPRQFEDIEESELSAFLARETRFGSWAEMVEAAKRDYVSRLLGVTPRPDPE